MRPEPTKRPRIPVRGAALGVALASALALVGCTGPGQRPAGGGRFVVGIKFDQPGLGLRTGSRYSGLDVAVATYVAEQLGHQPSDITWVQAPSAQRETLITTGQVDIVVATYSITDQRKEKVSFAGPYFVAGQDLLVRSDDTSITGPDTLTGKTLCSVTGSTSAQKVLEKYPGVQLQEFGTYSQCVAALVSSNVDAVTTDNAILAGYAAQPAYKGKVRVVGKTFSVERYGIGLRKGNVKTCEKITAAITKMIASGAWEKAVEANLAPSGITVDRASNPPKQDPCS
ncbi:MAG TPA: glutamate ABC transporter substrate-binding protein [Pedococcus sp.]|nr:glutamate ABC transporter substrate-binding protein [Pedococcus sp.]